MRNDIVYILKEGLDPDELIYSLRSVEKNFPHRKVWFVGAQPPGLFPDGRIIHRQEGLSKWSKVRSSLEIVCATPEISDDFFLFNDDFFILNRQRGQFVNFSNGTLEKKINDIERKYGRPTRYSRQMLELRLELIIKKCDTVSFALHLPMLMNKKMLENTLNNFNTPMFRSAYGNFNNIPYRSHVDVKIYDDTSLPDEDWEYLSTTEDSFHHGKVGEFIRAMFPEPSSFEGGHKAEIRELYSEEGEESYD